jgi:hypothetical protein
MPALAFNREQKEPAVGTARPYAPSWLDRLFDGLEALPGPVWLAYAALLVPSTLLRNAAYWVSGVLPVGEIHQAQTVYGFVTVALLAGMHHLRGVARDAFDDFRPALGDAAGDPERTRYELSILPARPAIAIALIVPLMLTYYALDPAAADVVGLTGIGLILRAVPEGITIATITAIVCQAIRQARIISRLHEVAERVDPLDPASLFAFSRLTARVGMIAIAFGAAAVPLSPEMGESRAQALIATWLVPIVLAPVAVFVLPLLGMHRRLVDGKSSLAGAAGRRQRALVDELREAIDARDARRIGVLDRALLAHRHERELIARAPTWPWSTGTLRGFVSALFLPIVLFLVQRALGQILG